MRRSDSVEVTSDCIDPAAVTPRLVPPPGRRPALMFSSASTTWILNAASSAGGVLVVDVVSHARFEAGHGNSKGLRASLMPPRPKDDTTGRGTSSSLDKGVAYADSLRSVS